MKSMKFSLLVIILAAAVLASCGNAETKADQSDTAFDKKADTLSTTTIPVENATAPVTDKSAQTKNVVPNGPNEILANIDKHLVSAAKYTVGSSGGILNCSVTVTNNLTDVTFQKALVEVSIQNDAGSPLNVNYYTAINIEPGMTKLIKVPNNSKGTKVVTTIVKVKSTELTNGEFVLTGSHFVAPE